MNKTLVQLCILSIATLYFVMAGIFDWPYALPIIGVLLIIVTFIAFLDAFSIKKYDGNMVVKDGEEGQTVFSLELEAYPEDLKNRESISFKVVSDPEQ